MDCPDRERAQWWGDAVNEIGEAFYVFDAEKGRSWPRRACWNWPPINERTRRFIRLFRRACPLMTTETIRDGSWNRELPRQMLPASVSTAFGTTIVHGRRRNDSHSVSGRS